MGAVGRRMALARYDADAIVDLARSVAGGNGWIGSGIWYVLGLPLRVFYFDGLWGGRSGEDICCQLTNVDAAFWTRDDASGDVCRLLLDRKFGSFGTSVAVIVYFLILAWMARCAARKLGC